MAHDGKAVDTDYQEDSTDDTSMHCSYSRRLFYGAGHVTIMRRPIELLSCTHTDRHSQAG